MLHKTWWAACLGLAAVIGLGCGGDQAGTDTEGGDVTTPTTAVDASPSTPDTSPTPTEGEATPTEGEDASAAADITLSEDEIAQIEKLPAEDQVLALAQKVCPATDEPLGSMGVPVKVQAGDQTVFVCCKGCVEEVENDPAKYLAKLGKE